MRKLAFITLIVAAFAAPVVAQAQTAPPTPPPPPRPSVAVTPPPGVLPPVFVQQQTPPPPSVPAPGQRGGRGQGGQPGQQPVLVNGVVTRTPWQPPAQNIRIELTITDSATSRAGKKSVSMLLADGYGGRIRSGSKDGVLNVDGTARAGNDGRILLDLTIEYSPDRLAATAVLNESISVVVTSGQSTLVSRSADPATDRSVTLEVVATIVK